MINILIIIIVFSGIGYQNFAQELIFHKDSLSSKTQTDNNSNIKKLPVEILKGVVAADYKELGWNEYVPRDGVELPDIPIQSRKHHPRLITESQLIKAKEKIKTQPYRNWYNQIKRTAFYINPTLYHPIFKISDRIKMIALLYKIEDDKKFLVKIEELLRDLPDPPLTNNLQGGIVGEGWGDFLESAQAIVSLCVALDLTYNDIDPEVLESTLKKMFIRTDQILNSFAYTPANNHLLVMGIALMEMALLIDQPEEYIAYNRQQIWNMGWGHVSRALGRISPDGGYAEGVDYARFILRYLSAFSIHLYNNTGVKLFENPVLNRMLFWVMANDKSKRNYAKFDDALNGAAFIFPLVIPFSPQGATYNKYFESFAPLNRAMPNMVEGICVYKKSISNISFEPDNIQFFPDMGQAVFKDSFFNPELFVSILGERERWFSDRHEHIDPLSIEFTAFGEDMLIDPGYGQWTSDYNRTSWYTIPFAHNGILVDGLGNYRNPIWGDSIGSSMSHAYQTPDMASATVKTRIQDVRLSRKAFFVKNNFLFLVDRIKGNSKHSISLNFNHKGSLIRISENQFRIKNENTTLEVVHNSTLDSPTMLTKNFGLQTPPTPAAQVSNFKLEQQNMKNGYFATVMIPQKITNKRLTYLKKAIKGQGTATQIIFADATNSQMEYAVNSGSTIETADWKSDSRVLFLDIGMDRSLNSILLIEFTHFKYGNIFIKSSVPITLYLEQHKTQWLGYVESPKTDKEYEIIFEGMHINPVRFNHQILDNNKLTKNSIDKTVVYLTGSGSLEFGIGPEKVKMPYRYHNSANFLVWVKRKFDLGLNYNNLSDYDKQLLKNNIVGTIYQGVQTSAEYWSQKLFNTPYVFNHIANSVGLMQETISDMTFKTFDIPHRYSIDGNLGESKWRVLEDGMYTEKGLRIRNLTLQSFDRTGMGMNYQYFNFFPEHQSHSVRLNMSHNNFLYYQFAETNKSKEQHIQAQFQQSDYMINPGYSWNENSQNKSIFLNGRAGNYNSSFSHSVYNGDNNTYESLSGFGENWAFSASGQHTSNNNIYSENVFYNFSQEINISHGMIASVQDDWNLDNFYMDLNYTLNTQAFRGRYLYNQKESYQQLFYYLSSANYYVSSQINLNDFQFGKNNQLQMESGIQFDNDYQYYTNAIILHNNLDNKYNSIIYQQIRIPFGKYLYLHPVVEIQLPREQPYNWIGSGLTITNRFPVFFQMLINKNMSPNLVDYQFSIQNVTLLPNSKMMLWLHLQQQKDEIQNTEIRIQNINTVWQPGIYYMYNRYFGSRLEGYLEWYW